MTNQILGAVELGLVYGLMVLGVFITFRILKIPDLTVDGSITLGMAISAMVINTGRPWAPSRRSWRERAAVSGWEQTI